MLFSIRILSIVILALSIWTKLIIAQPDVDADDEEPRQQTGADEYITRTEEYLFASIFQNYSNRVRPCGPAIGNELKDACGPTNVKVFVYLRTVDDVNDKDNSFDLQLIFRQMWTDPRLSYKQLTNKDYVPQWLTLVADESHYKVWVPDTFFVNEKSGFRHTIDKDNIMLRIYPDGSVVYSFRVTLTLSCLMDFRYFPRDKQRCMMDVSSYAHTEQHIKYDWREENAILMTKGFKTNVANFELENIKAQDCPIITTTGKYSCIRLGVQFKRIFVFAHFAHLFLPSFVLVCVSWLSFWLGTEAIITRATVGLFCFLTLIIHSVVLSEGFPPASDFRSIDIWITTCLAFLIAVLLQLIFIYRITRLSKRDERNRPVQVIPTLNLEMIDRKKSLKYDRVPVIQLDGAFQPDSKNVKSDCEPEETKLRYTKPNVVIRKWRRCTRAQKFDVLCRAFFPLAFFLFNIAFWCFY